MSKIYLSAVSLVGDKSTMEMLQEDMLSFVVEGNTFVFDATPLKLGA